MAKESKSVRYDVSLSEKLSGEFVSQVIEKAAKDLGVYISHIGSYSRVKYPNSIHWHFKEHPKEKGVPGCNVLGRGKRILDCGQKL